MTEKKFTITLLSATDSSTLKSDYQDAIDAQMGTQIAKSLAVSAYITFIIPAAFEADYLAADQEKKEKMGEICQLTFASGQDFDTYYTQLYNEIYT
jgi:hypothetical protein